MRQRTKTKNPRSGFPMQLLLGLLFVVFGTLLLMKKIGMDYIPFVPENILAYGAIVGSIIGGVHLIITKLWRPRIYI